MSPIDFTISRSPDLTRYTRPLPDGQLVIEVFTRSSDPRILVYAVISGERQPTSLFLSELLLFIQDSVGLGCNPKPDTVYPIGSRVLLGSLRIPGQVIAVQTFARSQNVYSVRRDDGPVVEYYACHMQSIVKAET